MSVENILGALEGLRLLSIAVGPAGVHYDFARDANVKSGFISVLSNAAVTLQVKGGGKIFESSQYPPSSCQRDLEELMIGSVVTSAEIDHATNAARIILDETMLLSLLPGPMTGDVCWSIHKSPTATTAEGGEGGFVVYSDGVRPVQPPRTG
jgi:hypothetical protein